MTATLLDWHALGPSLTAHTGALTLQLDWLPDGWHWSVTREGEVVASGVASGRELAREAAEASAEGIGSSDG